MSTDSLAPISATQVAHLTVADAAGLPSPWSAASGLVVRGGQMYVVADDENALAVFDMPSSSADWRTGQLVALFEGELPQKPKARKAAKADLETLLCVPPFGTHAHGALLALASGSKPNRERAALIGLDTASGHLGARLMGAARVLDFSRLYAPLRAQLADLNLEGAWVGDGYVGLLNRANTGKHAKNACIRYEQTAFLDWLSSGAEGALPAAVDIQLFDLGQVQGVPLGFTDACAAPYGGWLFCAAAEATEDSYHDGAVTGAALGWVDTQGTLRALRALATPHKPEGIAIDAAAHAPDAVWLVTDADDRTRCASVLRVSLAELLAPNEPQP